MLFLRTLLIILSVSCVAFAEISSLINENNEVEGRKNHKHKHHFPYKVLFFHYIHGAIIILVIVKIALAMTLVGMITGLMKLFAAFKFIFQETASKSNNSIDHSKIIVPPQYQYHPSHDIEYDIPGSMDFDGYHHREDIIKSGSYPNLRSRLYSGIGKKQFYRSGSNNYNGINPRQDLVGGRNLGSDAAFSEQIKENEERITRDLKEELNNEKNGRKSRTVRSSNPVDENCMRRRICLLHARIRHHPMYTFNLYFSKKKGIAKYWDHDETKSPQDCLTSFPCHLQNEESLQESIIRSTEKSVADNKPNSIDEHNLNEAEQSDENDDDDTDDDSESIETDNNIETVKNKD